MRTEVEVLSAKVRLLNQVIDVITDMKNDLEKENKFLKEENEQLAEWLEQETVKLQNSEDYCQDLYLENKELKIDNERLTMTTNNNYELMRFYRDKYHELLENVNNLINKYERGGCDDCK